MTDAATATATAVAATTPAAGPPKAPAESSPAGHADRYDAAAVEAKWRERWEADDLYKVADDAPGPT